MATETDGGVATAGAARSRRASFGVRLAGAIDRFGGLCVGIDPHAALLDQWGLDADPAGLERFGRTVVAAAAGRVGVVKPQVAFFERLGSRGLAALERVLADARDTGLLVIADAKRGDIGSTNAGYADAWLDPAGPLASDALTISPYLGVGALRPFADAALRHGAGLFLLAATSNPEADAVQSAVVAGEEGAPASSASAARGVSVAAHVAAEVARWNAAAGVATPSADSTGGSAGGVETSDFTGTGVVSAGGARPGRTEPHAVVDLRVASADDTVGQRANDGALGSFGIVFGATHAPVARGLDIRRTPDGLPVLAPGFGAQGARLEDAATLFPGGRDRVLANVSRSVLRGAPNGLGGRIDQAVEALASAW